MASRVASWHHGSSVSVIFTPRRRRRSSSPCAVILGNRAAASDGMRPLHRAGRRLAEGLAIDFTGGRLGQGTHERDLARILVLAQPGPREFLKLARERIVAAARAHDECLHDLT